MDDKKGLRGEFQSRADEDVSFSNCPPHVEMAWMQIRIGWQSVQRTRLDQEKLDAIASITMYYRKTGETDRPRFDFEQVLLRLEEEHESRAKELERGARRSARVQKSTMRIVRDNDDAWMQDRRDRADETPKIIAEWKELMDMLFPATDSNAPAEKTGP